MAKQRKGCGLLISALVLFLLSGGLAAYLGYGAYNSGKKFNAQLSEGTRFTTPEHLQYKAEEHTSISVWIEGGNSESPLPTQLLVRDTASGQSVEVHPSKGSTTAFNHHLIATFPVEKGHFYQVAENKLPDGHTLILANVDPNGVLGLVGRILGAVFGGGAIAFLGLVLGIIGAILYFSSKPADEQTQPIPPLV
ncbi:hypothetical protein HW115_12295 [Verrucomicrobiaceae bacterium N1E253]|uniref:Uncharacterized protein n=1 Tax=Oceaniferula marina TaxID=2748318 RepID=A0A851GMM9_9BACT|nr:hypothetical protein [Oceaniferula marina]NWK56395.1 hypothetical protein [Oceaniferula marina]